MLLTGRRPGQWRKENEKIKGKCSAGCGQGDGWAEDAVLTLSLTLVKMP